MNISEDKRQQAWVQMFSNIRNHIDKKIFVPTARHTKEVDWNNIGHKIWVETNSKIANNQDPVRAGLLQQFGYLNGRH